MAATRKAAQAGYESVSMRELAETCKLSMTTIYQFCPSKDQLIAEAHLSAMEGFRRRMEDAPLAGATGVDRLRALLGMYTDGLTGSESSRTLLRAVYAMDPALGPIRAQLGAITFQLYDDAIGADEVPERSARIEVLGHVVDSALLSWLSKQHDADWVRERFEQAVTVLFGPAHTTA